MQSEDIYVVGDEKTLDSNIDITFSTFSKIPGVRSKTFQELIEKSDIVASDVPVLICFPTTLWNERVETGNHLYGAGDFGKLIESLVDYLTDLLDKRFPNATYVNHPKTMALERDKLRTKKLLSSQGIKVAENIPKNAEAVLQELEKG
ncbi:hypothetical protein DRJ25_04725, partial [Candidatus Woesearchaeota archaeon]